MKEVEPKSVFPEIEIAGRKVGFGRPCFIVAEVSANHHQNYEEAVAIIEAAAKAGVEAIKLQTYTPDTLTIDSHKPPFIVVNKDNPEDWKGRTLYELYQGAYTPWEWQPKLKRVANDLGMILFSTPFDETAVDFLGDMGVPCYKVASYEATHIPLLKKIAATGKPVIISVGFATLEEVAEAVGTFKAGGAHDIAVLHCVTQYAGKPDLSSINLKTITDIRERFGVVSGFSDNNAGIEAPILAAAAGASIIEKHFILDRGSGGPDAQFSLEPAEMKAMVDQIRQNEEMLGRVHYGPNNASEEGNRGYRRSVFAVANIGKGEKFTLENVRVIRPADGLPPRDFESVLGKTAERDIEAGTPLSWNLIQK